MLRSFATTSLRCLSAATLLMAAIACGTVDPPEEEERPPPERTVFGGDRPVTLQVPEDYDHRRPTPLIVLLHGYSASGLLQTVYLGLDQLAEWENVLLVAPDGTLDQAGNRFWNATEACCGFGSSVDDVAYLRELVEDIAAEYNVDRGRVYLVGHSNGGFMSYRLACEHADLFAAVVSIAGATFSDSGRCTPSSPVSVLQIHGDRDDTIEYEGGTLFGRAFPSAHDTVAQWAGHAGCTGALTSTSERLDLDSVLAGPETRVDRYAGCPSGVAVDLWTLEGGAHLPAFNRAFRSELWSWLSAQRR